MKLNNRGSSIMMILMISIVMAIGVGFLAARISSQQKLSFDLRSEVSIDLALRSLTDYAKYALKNEWCLDPTFRPMGFPQDNEGDAFNCYRNYGEDSRSEMNLGRLLLNHKYAMKVVQLVRKYPNAMNGTKFSPACNPALAAVDETPALMSACAESMKLKTVIFQASLSDLRPPISQVLADDHKRKAQIDAIRVTYQVMSSMSLPLTDDVVYVKIISELLRNGAVIQNGSRLASEEQLVLIAPRENNYFSLILRGNIYIGKNSVEDNTEGNLYIPMPAPNTTNYAGISFFGPVYINRNLVLPSGIKRIRGTVSPPPPYATFFEPVVFGAGRVLIDNANGTQGFKQASASGYERIWRDLSDFGGFGKGFEHDGKRDAGLDTIAGTTDAASASNDIIQCVNRLREQEVPAFTLDSRLYARTPATINTLMDGTTALNERNRRFYMGFWRKIPGATPTPQKIYYPLRRNFSSNGAAGTLNAANLGSGDTTTVASIPAFPAGTSSQDFSLMVDVAWKNGATDKFKEEIPIPDSGEVQIALKSSAAGNPTLTTLTIKSRKILIGTAPNTHVEPHLRDVEVAVTGTAADLEANPITYIKFRAMDNTCNLTPNGCLTQAQGGTGGIKDLYLRKFTVSSFSEPDAGACSSTELYGRRPSGDCVAGDILVKPPTYELFIPPGDSYGLEYDRCRNVGVLSAGGATQNEVEADFINRSHQGWEFITTRAANTDLIFGSENTRQYLAGAIYNVCTVPANINMVVGNFMCRELIIAPRTTKLKMIGTFVVLYRMEIPASAVIHGVEFYSVHTGVDLLRNAEPEPIFKRTDGTACNTLYNETVPFWHPSPGNKILADRAECSPVGILNRGTPDKFPFRWTSITADCIRYPDIYAADTSCLKKIRNRFFKTMDRRQIKVGDSPNASE